jgi:hypothetical protein
MKAYRLKGSCVALALLCAGPALAHGQDSFNLPSYGGAVITADTKTLIVSSPTSGNLVFIDLMAQKELKRVEMDFQPAALAIQGKKLFAATKGGAVVHVVDIESGKSVKEIRVPGEPVRQLACHPAKGLVYVSNTSLDVFAIDPETGMVARTKGKGGMLAMDAAEGKYLYAGIQKPIRDFVLAKPGPGKSVKISVARANRSAVLLKWAVSGADLSLEDGNDNAAVNVFSMAVSPDGKRVAMAGQGGWLARDGSRRLYGVAVYDTSDIKSLAGVTDTGMAARVVAFHPALNLGVTGRSGSDAEFCLFNGKSLIKKGKPFVLPKGHWPMYVTFGGQGAKLVYITSPNPGQPEVAVTIVPLPLSEQDREILKKTYPE